MIPSPLAIRLRPDPRAIAPRLGAVRLHLAGVAAVLALCLLAPRTGEPVLLVPLSPAPAQSLHARLVSHHLMLIGPGRVAGTWVARADHGAPDWTVLADGLLPIAVPGLLCGRTH